MNSTPRSFRARSMPTQANVMRQALAGMLWSKQFYYFDVNRWLEERGSDPYLAVGQAAPRNGQWHHMYNADVISMPDKWEYPWYAAWDLAFHVLPLTLVDVDFGKQQLDLMLSENYLHPNGQIPAYEWNFGDVNPPVHPWATIFTYRLEKARTGQGDIEWLERSFQKLLLNFTWWLNRKDRSGKNTFEGGFLGLDNIGVFDRSSPLPTGGYLEQADGTAWMALFSLNMLEIAIELAMHDATYADMALKFVQHFVSIASATIHAGGNTGMWDEEDGFFYDVLQLPNGQAQRLKVRSMVGCCRSVRGHGVRRRVSEEVSRDHETLRGFPRRAPGIEDLHPRSDASPATRTAGSGRFSTKPSSAACWRRCSMKRNSSAPTASARSRASTPTIPTSSTSAARNIRVPYLPGESDTGMFGGNSNWRGPIWMPVNALIIRALLQYYAYYGDDVHHRMPHRLRPEDEPLSSRRGNLAAADQHVPEGQDGRRPVNGGEQKFQEDPHWRDCLQFYEYFHGDNGAGLGANHQTGWTGVIARAMHLFATTTAGAGARTRQDGWRPDRNRRRPSKSSRQRPRKARQAANRLMMTMATRSLSFALPDQHPRLADGTVAQRSAARRRWTTFPTPSWTGWPRWASTGSGS